MNSRSEIDITNYHPLRGELGRLARIAAPAALTGFGWMAMGLVDTLMVGRLGAAELGGVAMANSLFFSVYVGLLGLVDATTPLISQALGAGDRRRAGLLLWQGIWLALVVAPPLAVACRHADWILDLLGQDPAVRTAAAAYLGARALGVVPHALFAAHRAFLGGLGDTHRVLRIVLGANVVNLVANQVLIFGAGPVPALGAAGAGYATSASMLALLVGGLLEVHTGRYRRNRVEARRPDLGTLREVVAMGWPMSAQYMIEVSMFSVMSVCIGWLGPVVLSAHQVGCSLGGLAFVVAGGFATAATVRVGEAHGRGDPDGVSSIGRLALGVTSAVMAGIGSLYLLAPRLLASAYTADPAVLDAVVGVLSLNAVIAVFDGLQLVASAALRATSDSRTPFVAHVLAHWLVGLPVGYLLAFPAGLGLMGFWIAITMSLGLVAVSLTAVFLRRAG